MSSDIFSSEIFEQSPMRARDVDPFRMDSAKSRNPARDVEAAMDAFRMRLTVGDRKPARAAKADIPARDFEDIPLTPPAPEDSQVYMDKDGVIHRRGA